jgi:HEAT repeat protein
MFGFGKKSVAKMSLEEVVGELLTDKTPRRASEALRRLEAADRHALAPILLRAVREGRGDLSDLAALIVRFEAIGYKDDEIEPWLPLGDVLAPALLGLRTGDNRAVSFAAKIAGPGCVAALAAKAQHSDAWVRQEVARGLSRTASRDATTTLLEMLHDADGFVRKAAAWAFVTIRDPRAVPALEKRVDDRDEDVAFGALAALEAIDPELGKHRLCDVLADEKRSPSLRERVLEKLRRSPAVSEPAVRAALERAAADGHERVRDAALATLGRPRDAVREQVGRAVEIAHRDWYGIPWSASPNTESDRWVRLPRGTWALRRIEDGFVYLSQGAIELKVDEGDFRAHWPEL